MSNRGIQNYFFPPAGALVKGKLVLAFGAGERARRLWLTALTIGAFFFGYYFFAEVWPALLGAGSG
jgi:hypothetical protein